MIEVSRLTLLLAGELLLGLTLLSGFLLGRLIVRKSKIRKAAHHLVEKIQTEREARTQRLRNRLAEQYRYEGGRLEEGVLGLTQIEMHLYQNIINSYLRQDVEGFQQTDANVEDLVLAYQSLDLPAVDTVSQTVESVVSTDEKDEIERLKAENQRLSEELSVTMDTMGRMLNEYSSMFAGGADNQLDKTQTSGISAKDEPITGQQVEDVAEDSELDKDTAFNMAESDLDGLVEPSIHIGESDSELSDFNQVEMQKHLDKQKIDSDIELSEASEMLPAINEDSMVDDLAQVDIHIAAVDETGEGDLPDPGSLEEEWAKLLAEDAESAESIAEDTESNDHARQGMV